MKASCVSEIRVQKGWQLRVKLTLSSPGLKNHLRALRNSLPKQTVLKRPRSSVTYERFFIVSLFLSEKSNSFKVLLQHLHHHRGNSYKHWFSCEAIEKNLQSWRQENSNNRTQTPRRGMANGLSLICKVLGLCVVYMEIRLEAKESKRACPPDFCYY